MQTNIDTQKAESTIVSAAYDPTQTYAVGDYCIYNNTLYRCNTEITTAEAWNSAHWTATSIASELENRLETEEIEAIKTSVKNQITASLYPVGSIYMSVSNTNPSNFFGGTWVAWGNGKVPVGVNTSDSSFNTVEKTGGAKTVNLSHSHTVNSHSHTMAHTHNYGVGLATYYGASTAEGGIYLYDNGSWVLKSTSNLGSRNVSINNGFAAGMTSKSLGAAGATASTSGSSAANTGTSSPGTNSKLSDATSILQPYITCYMWKRTA